MLAERSMTTDWEPVWLTAERTPLPRRRAFLVWVATVSETEAVCSAAVTLAEALS